eukprot:jgi/Mesen1/2640/ME000166S01769
MVRSSPSSPWGYSSNPCRLRFWTLILFVFSIGFLSGTIFPLLLLKLQKQPWRTYVIPSFVGEAGANKVLTCTSASAPSLLGLDLSGPSDLTLLEPHQVEKFVVVHVLEGNPSLVKTAPAFASDWETGTAKENLPSATAGAAEVGAGGQGAIGSSGLPENCGQIGLKKGRRKICQCNVVYSELLPPAAGKPPGTQKIPRDMIEATSDLYLHRLQGNFSEDLGSQQPKALLAMAVGWRQHANVNLMLQKFPLDEFSVMLFHYDGRVNQWDIFNWSSRVIHVAVPKQTKWHAPQAMLPQPCIPFCCLPFAIPISFFPWYAKRFMHPDVVHAYDHVLLWDEDLDLSRFNASLYIQTMRHHGLQISQPALSNGATWRITELLPQSNGVHTRTNISKWGEKCETGHNRPPCAGFVEIMAPVFSKRAWRCVWYMIQNDLVHGWGIDWNLGACANGPPHQRIGVVDSQPISHKGIRSLGDNVASGAGTGGASGGEAARSQVRERCYGEWREFQRRWDLAASREPEQGQLLEQQHQEVNVEEKQHTTHAR